MPDKSWTLIESRLLNDYQIFTLHADRYRLEPEGRTREFYKLDPPDWINVIALTDDRQVVLVRQFRHGVREVTLEIPGGMLDPGETIAEAALRELEEETGFAGPQAREIGCVWPNPAIQSNRCYTFLVEGAQRVTEPRPDPYERIEVLTRPLADMPRLMRSGEIRHALVIVAFAHFGVTVG